MNYTVKLLIPILLGAAAAAVNWVMLATRTNTVNFVAANARLEAGKELAEGDFVPVALPVEVSANLVKTAVPAGEVGILLGDVLQRTLEPGDLILRRDAMRGQKIELFKDEELFFIKLGDVAVIPQMLSIGKDIELRITKASGEKIWVGPFRLVSVDGRVVNDRLAQQEVPQTISVAYKRNSAHVSDLEDFCDRQVLEEAVLLGIRVIP